MSLIKIAENNESVSNLVNYINTEKATMIIGGILLSVLIAFSIGVIVQWVSRLIFSFQYEKKLKSFGFVFGGIALTAITYFIFIKGLKGSPYYKDLISYIGDNDLIILIISIIIFSLFSYVFEFLTKKSVLLVVIGIGTFGLALAFSGNDLVNFIGVSMAAYHSYEAWVVSGIDASLFSMEVLDKKVPAEPFLLFLAGGIMVLTLWFSKKATTDGVVLVPSVFSKTFACEPSIMATHEFVVPKSIPITLLIYLFPYCYFYMGVISVSTSLFFTFFVYIFLIFRSFFLRNTY